MLKAIIMSDNILFSNQASVKYGFYGHADCLNIEVHIFYVSWLASVK